MCDDSCEYAYKDGSTDPLIPHSEWFCTHLAEAVGISGPICQKIEMLDGTLVFGSRWEGGVLPDTGAPSTPAWVTMVKAGRIPLDDIRIALTRIYAFDLFIHNTDRHPWNFLVRSQRSGHAVLAFDYSRAWVCHGLPLPPLPFDTSDPGERTIGMQRYQTQEMGPYIDKVEAGHFLEKMKKVPKSFIKRTIEDHPAEWLTDGMKRRILRWWLSADMLQRIDGIAKGIGDGSYL
jgi:hypothetical protein